MPVPDSIVDLVERFERNIDAYRSSEYKEAQVRAEFVNPFFEALGWDVRNTQGHAEAYKDVIHEDSIKVGGASEAPDYCFRIGGTRKFFVETKKPAVSVESGLRPAYQLRRYAWSAKLPLSILTSFREFAVYDCRIKPSQTDKSSVARVMRVDYADYAEKWDEIASRFSKEAILQGSFDKYADSTRAKRGTTQVDDAFLKEIESWRDMLARSIAIHNPALSQRELNFAVQRTIDRIVFLRICEDRGTENYKQLMGLVGGPRVYPRLLELFRRADDRYNSGLFHFQREKGRAEAPDELTLSLNIEDTPLRGIIKGLYYPDSPYEFSVLPSDILGQVYEQFLGKVIRLTAGHQAKVEDKPEVKKAGGVYYTPTYIVDYIVKNTVGKLLEGKTPKDVEKLRILDPACGSGSFLIAAYQYLLDWHAEWYAGNDPGKWAKAKTPRVYSDRAGWRLTNAERKRILVSNIFGVDIDSQAVEVTKLSLLLKILEKQGQLQLGHERMLPDLGGNIKCGNSLIGPDFYSDREAANLDPDERLRINAFDWQTEFPDAMKAGGFDAVIGNPPYVRMQTLAYINPQQARFLRARYECASSGNYDIYVVFVERGLALLRQSGRLAFILPNKFFTTDYGVGLRRLLSGNGCVDSIVDFEDAQVFQRAGTYTCLLFLGHVSGHQTQYAALGRAFRLGGTRELETRLSEGALPFAPLSLSMEGNAWHTAVGTSGLLLGRLQSTYAPFGSFQPHIFQGLITGADKIYVVHLVERQGDLCRVCNGLSAEFRIETELLRQTVKGEHVQRYELDFSAQLFVIYPYNVAANGRARLMEWSALQSAFPLGAQYLTSQRDVLAARDRGIWRSRPDWYAYSRSQNIGAFQAPKVLVPYMSRRLRVVPDTSGAFFVNITTGGYGLRVVLPDHHESYAVGLLNSVLLNHCMVTNRFRGGYFAVNKQMLERLPIRQIDFCDPADKARHDRMVVLVDQMLTLHKQLADARLEQEATAIQRQIDALEGQIDLLVYELYGLTDEEIAIVEGSAP